MLFNSYMFWCFFGIVFLIYRLLRHRHTWQNILLVIASYVFYGTWNYRFLSLILISTVVDYFAAIGIEQSDSPARRKGLCFCSIAVNLGLLGVFKYYGFFATEVAAFLGMLGLGVSLPSLNVLLPVGISFYTFQTMSYTIDVYRGTTKPIHSFINFALYVCFFPQLVAGPIERSSRLMPQIVNPRSQRAGDFADGLYLVLIGLFKKVVIADNMATIANAVFATDPSVLSGFDVLVGSYAFAFQIYGDFSGYSAIARGVAKWLGFDLMTNFRTPYFATSPTDFWQRWHISLSTWLRDYLYIPLGGSRHGTWKTYRNLILTMLLGGLWHGAKWTFVFWGLYHGVLLAIHRAIKQRWTHKDNEPLSIFGRAWRIFLTFHLISLGLLIFRSQSMAHAGAMLQQIWINFRVTDLALYSSVMIPFFLTPLLIFEYWLDRKDDLLCLAKVHWFKRGVVYSYFVLMIWFFLPRVHHEFIYFQF